MICRLILLLSMITTFMALLSEQEPSEMASVFADSFYFFALFNRHDVAHAMAVAFNQSFPDVIVTTGFVLTEFADGCASTPHRRSVLSQTVRSLRANPKVMIAPCTDKLFLDGLDLFEHRPDKEWSLTDCISFVVMQQEGITEALTGDKHFEQAGFIALLK